MSERKPAGMPFESWVDSRIRDAQERGEFDDLPGKGKPLPGHGQRYDEDWWLRQYVRREGIPGETLLPTPLRLRKEIEQLPAQVRDLRSAAEVRERADELNKRIVAWVRAGAGPRVPVAPVNVDELVAEWRNGRETEPRQEPGPAPRPPKLRWWRRRRR